MSQKLDVFKNTLESKYDHENFVLFTREFLTNMQEVRPYQYIEKISSAFKFYVAGYFHIGNYKSTDGNIISVFSICLHKGDTVERARVMQRNFVKRLMENGNCAGALVAFYTEENPEKWRLSFIRMDYEFSNGKLTQNLTPAKRYSSL